MPDKKKIPTNLPLAVRIELLLHPEHNPTNYTPFERATQYEFEPKADTWSRVNAWWLADASWIAYWHDATAVTKEFRDNAGIPACELIANEGTECYVAHSDEFAIVAFRGTQPDDWHDLLDIIRFKPCRWDIGHVHAGFAAGLEAVRRPLEQALNSLPARCRVWFTGHSLGAAIATLAAYRYRDVAAGVYTFGSPRVGNRAFARHFDPLFEGRSNRYVNDRDLVTHVPPKLFACPHGLYTHVDHLRWINQDGSIRTRQPVLYHSVRDMFSRNSALLDRVQLLLRDPSIELPAALSDHTPLYYAIHCWNDFATHVRDE